MEFRQQYGEYKLVKEGKTRKLYREDGGEGGIVALVATDDVPAFNEKPQVKIPGYGKARTRLSGFWAEWYDSRGLGNYTLESTAYYAGGDYHPYGPEENILPIELRAPELKGRVTEQAGLIMFPFKFIVYGFVTGALEQAVKDGDREISGVVIPEGLKPGDRLPEPIFAPMTITSEGWRSKNCTEDDIVNLIMGHPEFLDQIVERYELNNAGEVTREGVAGIVNDIVAACVEFYVHAAWYAESRGLIIAEAGFEVGIRPEDGDFYFGDELLTLSCAEYWDKRRYDLTGERYSMDKQFIYDCLREAKNHGVNLDHYPIPDVVIWQEQGSILQLLEKLTGGRMWLDWTF